MQILWLNTVVDIPIAVALGFDDPRGALMRRQPRPVNAPVLNGTDWVRLCVQGLVMTVGSLVAYQIGAPDPLVAGTMLLTTLSLYHLAAGLLARDDRDTILTRTAIPSATQLRRYAFSLLAIVLVTALGFLRDIFHTTGLTFTQWCICTGLAASVIVVEETTKFAIRRRDRRRPPQRSTPVPASASGH